DAVRERWPTPEDRIASLERVAFDDTDALLKHVLACHPAADRDEVRRFLRTAYQPSPQALELRERARAGKPPTPPQPRKGQDFILQREGGRGATYSWVQLGRPEVQLLSSLWERDGRRSWPEAVLPQIHLGLPFCDAPRMNCRPRWI